MKNSKEIEERRKRNERVINGYRLRKQRYVIPLPKNVAITWTPGQPPALPDNVIPLKLGQKKLDGPDNAG